MADLQENERPHDLILKERGQVHISGVTEVESFDEQSVKLKTTCGMLTICGQKLHISHLQLETGDVRLSGHVDSLIYSQCVRPRSLLGRMFR